MVMDMSNRKSGKQRGPKGGAGTNQWAVKGQPKNRRPGMSQGGSAAVALDQAALVAPSSSGEDLDQAFGVARAIELFEGLDGEGRAAALDETDAPVELLEVASHDLDEDVLCAVGSHPNATPEMVKRAWDSGNDRVRSEITKGPHATRSMVADMRASNYEHRAGALRSPAFNRIEIETTLRDEGTSAEEASHLPMNPNISGDQIVVLYEKFGSDPYVCRRIAQSERTPPAVIGAIWDKAKQEEKFSGLKGNALRSKHATKEMVTEAIREGNSDLAMTSPAASVDQLRTGFEHGDARTRSTAVRNGKFPADLLPAAMNDSAPLVRSGALRSAHATKEMVRTGLGDDHASVRDAAVSSPLNTAEDLDQIIDDPDAHPSVRTSAQIHRVERFTSDGSWE